MAKKIIFTIVLFAVIAVSVIISIVGREKGGGSGEKRIAGKSSGMIQWEYN
jgi:hypothetical protein